MNSLFLVIYGLYFVLVGFAGNAEELATDVTQETEFVYWIVAIAAVALLWESPVGGKVAKPFAVLIVLGFLLNNNNYQTIFKNAQSLFTTQGTSPT